MEFIISGIVALLVGVAVDYFVLNRLIKPTPEGLTTKQSVLRLVICSVVFILALILSLHFAPTVLSMLHIPN